ncbi:hypothetical protein BJX61DRAFT_985 [Aspergillus egyptiacus]|nr:hypothetical protein BJX61DRAFT_985 [Aspergillus egyptiacus]
MPPALETISYGPHALQTITIANPFPSPAPPHSPENSTTNTGYWVILIHGGAWRDPTQTSVSYLTPALSILSTPPSTSTPAHSAQPNPLNRITALASISYRLSPHPAHPQNAATERPTTLRAAKHPDHLADVCAALGLLQEKYGFGSRYVLVGHSCGATLAFQSVMSSLFSGLVASASARTYLPPTAILGMAGIYDLRLLRDTHKDIAAYQEFSEGAFGADETVWDAVSPAVVRGVGGVEGWEEGRVVVLAHSTEDTLCDSAQSEVMKRFLEGGWKAGGEREREVYFLPVEGDHNDVWTTGEGLARGILSTLERLQELGL